MQVNSVYSPIQGDQVRLVKFSHNGDNTSAILQTFSLKGSIPRYFALSYTWTCIDADAARDYVIQIAEQQLPVLNTLQPFFHVLSLKGDPFDDVWWWIDSICIDLDNLVERAQQVQLMEHIYRHAHDVICWLGKESDDTDRAVDFIKLLNRTIRQQIYSVEEIRSMFQQDRYRPHWAAVTSFYQRRWWTRIWTLQEYAIPASLSFWCGTRSLSRYAVEGALMAGDQCSALAFKGLPAFRHGFNRRKVQRLYDLGRQKPATHKSSSMSLVALAAYSSCFEATDDRDRLYGVRALAADAFLLSVDYALSVDEVYLRFVKSFVEHYKCLDIICFASIYSASPGSLLPSWVPDWRTTIDPLSAPLMVSQSARSHVGNLRPPRLVTEPSDPALCYNASENRAAVCGFEGWKLLAHGTVLDTVDGLVGSGSAELVQTSSVMNSTSATSVNLASSSSSLEILRSVCKSLVLDRKDRFMQTAMPVDEFLRDFLWLCAKAPVVSKEFREWFNWTKHLDVRGHRIESILRDSNEVIRIINSSSASEAPNQDEYIMDTFFGRFFDTVVRMSLRLMVTCDGRIGMVPDKARKGDTICVVFGCNVPILLRQQPDAVCDNGWTFIGECFLDGFMQGECFKQPDFLERLFCIG